MRTCRFGIYDTTTTKSIWASLTALQSVGRGDPDRPAIAVVAHIHRALHPRRHTGRLFIMRGIRISITSCTWAEVTLTCSLVSSVILDSSAHLLHVIHLIPLRLQHRFLNRATLIVGGDRIAWACRIQLRHRSDHRRCRFAIP